jgi:hypothetical protein
LYFHKLTFKVSENFTLKETQYHGTVPGMRQIPETLLWQRSVFTPDRQTVFWLPCSADSWGLWRL